MPETVTTLGDGCFSGCTSLNVALPETVTTLGDGCFSRCTSLERVELRSTLTHLGEGAFSGCTGLREVTIHDGAQSIPQNCFNSCADLRIIFAGGAPAIDDRAFSNATAEAFYPVKCAGWTEETLQGYNGTIAWIAYGDLIDGRPWSVPEYAWSADDSTVSARHFCLDDEALEESETVCTTLSVAASPTDAEMGATAFTARFANACFETQTRTVQDIPALGDMALLRLPDGLTAIGDEAFANLPCEGVILPEGVTSIGARAFAGCDGLIYVRVPNGLNDIAEDAFEGCPRVRLDQVD